MMTPKNERPEDCRDTCLVAQCEGSGCRFLHDEAKAREEDQRVITIEKKEGRHARNRT